MRRWFSLILLLLFLSGCSKQDHPDIVLITIDTVRADYLGCYGNSWIETPNLDRFAATGVRFDQAVCQIPATLTSHTAILTSLYPRTSGVRFGSYVVPDEVTTLAEVLSGQGYQTAAFIGAGVLDSKYNLDQGFDVYDDEPLDAFERPASDVNGDVFEWLERNYDSTKPLFLWVHYYDAHSPYFPPSPWDTRYDPNYQGTFTGSSQEITQMVSSKGAIASRKDLKHLQALYAGEISALDEEVGKLLARLSGLLDKDNTITTIMADHGEMLGEHHKFFHGEDLYEPAVRIPFMISYPAKIPEGLVVEDLVHTLDFMPTVLGLAGLPIPEEVQGSDLSEDLIEERTLLDRNLTAFLESEEPFLEEGDKVLGVRTLRWKFINHRAHKRPPALYGRVADVALDRPMFARVFVKGEGHASVSAHIRYHDAESFPQGHRCPRLASIPSTYIDAVPIGSDPIHTESADSASLGTPNPGWRVLVTPNLYERALEYGQTMNYPTRWMRVESVAVDLSVPWNRKTNRVVVDNLELVVLRKGKGKNRWVRVVLADLESGKAAGRLVEAATGPARTSRFEWVRDSAFPGNLNLSQGITVQFAEEPKIEIDELYDLNDDPEERVNLLHVSESEDAKRYTSVQRARKRMAGRIEEWVKGTPGHRAEAAPLSAEERDKLRALGYIR